MKMLQHHDYRRLARESSNWMMRHDGELVQGNLEEARLAIRQAGLLRLQMAQLSQEGGDTCRAIADFLSAASCFLKAGDLEQAEQAVRLAGEAGAIPPERQDLLEAMAERKSQLQDPARRHQRLHEEVARNPE